MSGDFPFIYHRTMGDVLREEHAARRVACRKCGERFANPFAFKRHWIYRHRAEALTRYIGVPPVTDGPSAA